MAFVGAYPMNESWLNRDNGTYWDMKHREARAHEHAGKHCRVNGEFGIWTISEVFTGRNYDLYVLRREDWDGELRTHGENIKLV